MSALRQIEAKAAAAPTPAPVVESAGAPSLTISPQTTSTPNWVRSVNFRHPGFPGPNPQVPAEQGTLGFANLARASTVPRLPCRARTGNPQAPARDGTPYNIFRPARGEP